MKKRIALLVTFIIILNLCACGSSTSTSTSAPTAAPTAAPAPAEAVAVPEEETTPGSETNMEKIMIDASGMTETYETGYRLLEDVLSGRTDYLESTHTYSFTKGDNENIRDLDCDGIDTGVMVTLMRNGDRPEPDEQIDYIYITLVGSGSTIQNKIAFFQMCAMGTVLLTHPEINTDDEALQFYNKVVNNDNAGTWIGEGGLEYNGRVSSIGTDAYLVDFGVRVAERYAKPSSEDQNAAVAENEDNESDNKENAYFPMNSYEFVDAYNQSEHALGTLDKNNNTMQITGSNLEIIFFVIDTSENSSGTTAAWGIPEKNFDEMMVRMVSHGSNKYDTNYLTAISLIGQSFAEVFDPTFDVNDFVNNCSTSVAGDSITLSYSHNKYEYKLECYPITVGSSGSYYYDFIISLSANKE